MEQLGIILGFLSLVILIINFYKISNDKLRHWPIYVILGFSFPILTLVSEYALVRKWVIEEDWSALMDVIPTMYYALIIFVIAMILLNSLSLYKYLKKVFKIKRMINL